MVGGCVIIGYGNELRGDDAVGPQVARAISGLRLPHVQVRIVQQLTLELCELLARFDDAIFIDARSIRLSEGALLEPVLPNMEGTFSSAHSGHPDVLLALALALYGRHPRGWLVTIPAEDFTLGAPLSEKTRLAVPTAIEHVRGILSKQER